MASAELVGCYMVAPRYAGKRLLNKSGNSRKRPKVRFNFEVSFMMSTAFRSEFEAQRSAPTAELSVSLDHGREMAARDHRLRGGQSANMPHSDDVAAIAQTRSGEFQASSVPQGQSLNRSTGRIAIQSKGRILLLDAIGIIAVRAQGNYVLLEGHNGSHLLRQSMSTMGEKLKPHGFVRIHRSVLINSAHVEEVRSSVMGEYRLRIRSGKMFTVSRRYVNNLKSLAEIWLTTDR
jgi:hypothetical protein